MRGYHAVRALGGQNGRFRTMYLPKEPVFRPYASRVVKPQLSRVSWMRNSPLTESQAIDALYGGTYAALGGFAGRRAYVTEQERLAGKLRSSEYKRAPSSRGDTVSDPARSSSRPDDNMAGRASVYRKRKVADFNGVSRLASKRTRNSVSGAWSTYVAPVRTKKPYTKTAKTRVATGPGRTIDWAVRGKMLPIAFITDGGDMPDGAPAVLSSVGSMLYPSDYILNTVTQKCTPAGGAVTQGFYWCPRLSDFPGSNDIAAISDSYCIKKATMKLMPSINMAGAQGATLPTLWCIPVRPSLRNLLCDDVPLLTPLSRFCRTQPGCCIGRLAQAALLRTLPRVFLRVRSSTRQHVAHC